MSSLAWWYLRRRGLVWQVNTPDRCHDIYERDGRRYDRGWHPIFTIRYGKQPVYAVAPALRPSPAPPVPQSQEP